MADDDHVRAGQGKTLDVPARGGQMNLVPDRRNRQLKVRVVGQNGFSSSRVSTANYPIIATQAMANFVAGCGKKFVHRLRESRGQVGGAVRHRDVPLTVQTCLENRVRLHVVIIVIIGIDSRALGAVIEYVGVADNEMVQCGFRGEEVFGMFRSRALRNSGTVQFSFPGTGQRPIHIAGNCQRVGGPPGLRFVTEEREFQRKVVLVLLDELVYAAGIGFDNLVSFGLEKRGIAVRGAAEPEGVKIPVSRKRPQTKNFGKLASREAPQQVHLPEAVLRHDVPLRLGEILDRCGANVRHAPAVAVDRDLVLKSGKRNAPVELWQRAVDKPPDDHAGENNEESNNPKRDSEKGSQVHSRAAWTKISLEEPS